MADRRRGAPRERRRDPHIQRAARNSDQARRLPSCRSAGWSRIDERERPAISIVAVLRQVREALDPGYATRRVRIAALPLVPT